MRKLFGRAFGKVAVVEQYLCTTEYEDDTKVTSIMTLMEEKTDTVETLYKQILGKHGAS